MNKFLFFKICMSFFWIGCVNNIDAQKPRDTFRQNYLFWNPRDTTFVHGPTFSIQHYSLAESKAYFIKNQNYINDELTLFISLVAPTAHQTRALLLKKIQRVSLPLIFHEPLDSAFRGNFVKYMPKSSSGIYTKPKWFSLGALAIPLDYYVWGDVESMKNYPKSKGSNFRYSFRKYPVKFNFPEDIISGYEVLEHVRKFQVQKYFFLDLPRELEFYVKYENLLYNPIYPRNGVAWAPLNYDRILLNAAFKPIYDDNIKIIWDLYLIKLKFEIIQDTLVYNNAVIPWQPPIQFDLYSPKVMSYLCASADDDPLMYESYFELILWEMYMPEAFEKKKWNGRKRKFNFKSNNPKYPGNYEVKFNIYEPYEFKVRKR